MKHRKKFQRAEARSAGAIGRYLAGLARLNSLRLPAVLVIGLLIIGGHAAAVPASPGAGMPAKVGLTLVADYSLPGEATRWDYMGFDPLRSRLFIAHLGDSAVVVFDTVSNKVIGNIDNIGGVHGTLAVPELGRVYATATDTNEVVVIDADSLKILARIPTGRHPNGLAYAPEVHKLYVSDQYANADSVIDVRANTRRGSVPLGGEIGNTQYDPASKHIFVNVRGTGELVEIDPAKDVVIRRITVPGGRGNHGLLIEPRLRLAFSANKESDMLQVMDLNSGTSVAHFPLGSGPDVLAYDEGLGILYIASESGVLSEFKVSKSGVSKQGESVIGNNAHTVIVEPATHKVYLPFGDPGRPPVLRVLQPVPGADRERRSDRN